MGLCHQRLKPFEQKGDSAAHNALVVVQYLADKELTLL